MHKWQFQEGLYQYTEGFISHANGQFGGFEGLLESVANDLTTCYNGTLLIDTENSCYFSNEDSAYCPNYIQ